MSTPHRLTGIYLINTRTSGERVSSRIGFIDPQGAASLVGENAAGKTTTLMILPYFFGAAPSWSSSGGNVHPIEFLLPQADCAIAFEYDRGDTGKRLAVLRGDGHSPKYRIIKSGFRREFFIGDQEGKALFLSDDHLRKFCLENDIERTDEMGINQYQTVILGAKHGEVHDRKFVRLGYDYSYAGDGLPNLNLLMAGIIKKSLRFKDLKQVIAALVTQRLGGSSSTLKLPDMREITGRLAGDYESVKRVLDNRANEAQLLELIQKSRIADHTMGLTLQRLEATQSAWRDKIDKAQKAALEAQKDLDTAEIVGENEIAAAQTLIDQKRSVESAQQTNLDPLELQERRFAEQDAPGKARLVRTLPDLISRRNEAIANAAAVDAHHSTTIQEFKAQEVRAADRHATEMTAFNEQRDADIAAREKETRSSENIGAARRTSLVNGRREAIEPAEEALTNARVATRLASEKAKKPNLPDELLASQEVAQEALDKATKEKEEAVSASNLASKRFYEAQAAFPKSERDLESAQWLRGGAQEHLASVRASIKPPSGSLQEFLLGLPDSPNRDRLVRLVAPALLPRTDLAPVIHETSEQVGDTAFGVSVDLSGVDLPDWANPGAMESKVAAAESRLAKAEEGESAAKAAVTDAAKILQGFEDAKTKVGFALTAADRKQTEARARVDALREKTRLERLTLMESANKLVDQTKAAERAASDHLRSVRTHWDHQLSECDAQNRNELEDIRNRYETDHQFQERRKALQERQRQERARISELQDLALREKGADPERIRAAEKQADEARSAVEDVEAFRGLVESWRQWIDGAGPARLEELRAAIRTVKAEIASLRARKIHIEADVSARTEAARSRKSNADRLRSDLGQECVRLENLALQYAGAVPADAGLKIDSLPFSSVDEAKASYDTAYAARNKAQLELKNATITFRDAFAARGAPGQVQDLLEPKIAELGDNPTPAALAQAYVAAQRTIAANLVPNIWNTYRTLRSKLSSARDRLADFRRQVTSFDKLLQQGMVKVTQFDSIQNLELRVTTDSDRVPWLGQLEHALGTEDDEIMAPVNDLPQLSRVQALQRFSQNISTTTQSIDLASILTLSGFVEIHHVVKRFSRDEDLTDIDSNGMTVITKTVLVIAIMNCIRGDRPIWLPYVLDEISTYDDRNFASLMRMLNDNFIDVLTATPDLSAAKRSLFSRQYNLKRGGIIGKFVTRPEDTFS